MDEIIAVRYGTRPARKSELFYRYASYGEPDADQSLDYFFWVLRDGDRVIVVDTGFDEAVGRRRGRTCLCPPRQALARLGIDPRAVGQVIVTHFHYDHTGNLGAFPDAELLVPERELEFWTGPLAGRPQFAQHVEPEEVARIAAGHRDGRVRTVGGRVELSANVTAVTVGGHSPGQLILLVDGPGGRVVLTSDAVHFYEELDRGRPFDVIVDLEEMYRAYDLLHELEGEGAVLVPGHDPEVMRRFPSVGGAAADLAVRIA